jgi:RNase P/RNase MRP subunit p29
MPLQADTYVYDLSGRRLRERTTQWNGQAYVTYQDNHLAYDALGNLRDDVADGRVHIAMEYDKVGNRTRVATYVDYQGVSQEVVSNTDRYFKYDAMNRQVVVDAVDAAGNIGQQQGHQITYDRDGNRLSDTAWGNRVAVTGGNPDHPDLQPRNGRRVEYGTAPITFVRQNGWSVEQYRYDALDRMTSVVKDGVQIDVRLYDGADRVIQSARPATCRAATTAT